MKKIIIDPTKESPKVVLDKENGVFEFSGNSLPENVTSFYFPILSWFDDYIKEPNEKTQVVFTFEYYNTSSSKMILKILEKLREIHRNGLDVEVLWRFKEEDEDMIEAGEDYFKNIKLPVQFVSYKP